MRLTRVNLVTITAAFILAGGLIAGVATLASFAGYSSTGVMRLQMADEKRLTGVAVLQEAMQSTLTRGSLAEVIQRPGLNLYSTDRTRLPLEDVIEKMKRDIRVQVKGFQGNRMTMSVTFQYPDAALAQRTTEALMERLRNEAVAKAPVEVIEAATLGQPVLTGKRWKVVGSGMLGGLALGILCGFLWSVIQNRQRFGLRRIVAFAVAGTAVGLTIAMLVPNVYISSAVLRTTLPVDLDTLRRTVLSDQALGKIIRDEGLYSRGIASEAQEDVNRMRQHIGVQQVDGNVYMISFRDHDPAVAQRVTRNLISSWLKGGLITEVRTEVLDPPSLPALPISPNRSVIALLGTFAGLLIGLVAARFRRQPQAA